MDTRKSLIKKAVIVILLLSLAAFIVLKIIAFAQYDSLMNKDPDERHFGKLYDELSSDETSESIEIGNAIVKRVKSCMEYTGNKDSAYEKDALSKFYFSEVYPDTARSDVEIKLEKALTDGDKGSVWIRYTMELFDKKDELIYGVQNALARCAIEKDDKGEWIVTEVDEAP